MEMMTNWATTWHASRDNRADEGPCPEGWVEKLAEGPAFKENGEANVPQYMDIQNKGEMFDDPEKVNTAQ
jgi:hypothetical protein